MLDVLIVLVADELQQLGIRQQDIAALNAELKKAGLAAIDPNKSPNASPSADADGVDEP